MEFKYYMLFKHLGKSMSNFMLELLNTTIELSGSVCLVAGLIGAILYIFGWEKGKKAPLLFWGIHMLIRLIGGVLIGL